MKLRFLIIALFIILAMLVYACLLFRVKSTIHEEEIEVALEKPKIFGGLFKKEKVPATSVDNAVDQSSSQAGEEVTEEEIFVRSYLKSGKNRGSPWTPNSIKVYDPNINGSQSSTPLKTIPLENTEPDFTLVLQSSYERAYLLEHHCERWEGPISLVITLSVPKFAVDVLRELIPSECARRTNIVIYILDKTAPYPINQLRNIGIQEVETSHYFVLDVDFLPDRTLYRRLRNIRAGNEELKDYRLAIVIPAFAYSVRCGEPQSCRSSVPNVPGNLTELSSCFDEKKCDIFDWKSPSGHSTTGYHEWYEQKYNQLRKIPCFKSNRYEPYMVLRKTINTPLYDERFHGYGKNKIQLVVHVRYLGWEFYVMPVSFVIHSPHRHSASRKEWERSNLRAEMDAIYREFLVSLQKKPKNMRTHKCKN